LGYTYADVATAHLIRTTLANVVLGLDAFVITLAWHRVVHSTCNLSQTGMAMMAIAAVGKGRPGSDSYPTWHGA
jgi:L-alanine-DL-glutamate epimerase-like enolase superfamily enzyme